ncbi:uncharacterized protein LOC123907577 isoform X1 [Trifolium pratense]|uniref:Uncharacterized protein n=1 Tax=Trifolium pratense TaxID=57577 RepID=A0ACB0JPS3_TRIPR|nr:uncharacterized protein LOC123907577 isoform X1 [Trifolium pratense]CAJ2647000.1 unnamed protein product [Trifolium pratense]
MAEKEEQNEHEQMNKLFSSYIGISFSVFIALLPKNLREHSLRAFRAEEELRQIKSRRQEDYKANARVAEIFASHRNSWRDEEKRLLRRIDAASDEIARLRAVVEDSKARVEDLEREVVERDEMIAFISRRFQEEGYGGCGSRGGYGGEKNSGGEWDEMVGTTNEEVDVIYQQHSQHVNNNGFDSEFIASSGSKFWAEKASLWQDVQYESLESTYTTKQFVARRESPWKVDGDSAGISSKLKLLEQELINLDKVGKDFPSKVSSSIKKQAKRYQSLSEKIDDLCRRIASDPCDPSLGSEFRTQTQTEFLLEAFRLQQDASETAQKLMALHTEVGKTHYRDELRGETTLTTRRSLDSIRNNFRELQRNLEIWLARIIGDLEGILARDGASRVREYYISRYPFVQ